MKYKIFIIIYAMLICISQNIKGLTIYRYSYISNVDVMFNRKIINPTFLNDTITIFGDITFHKSLIDGLKNSYSLSTSGEFNFDKAKNTFGFFNEFSHSESFIFKRYTACYKHSFSLSENSLIKTGINLELWHYELKMFFFDGSTGDTYIGPDKEIANNLFLNLGVAYSYKKQNIRLSYNNQTFKDSDVEPSKIRNSFNGLIINYDGSFKLSKKVTINPEVYYNYSPENKYGVFALKANYDKFISAGILYNTYDSYGILLSGMITKAIRINYYFNIFHSDNNKNYYSNSLTIAYLLK